MKGIISNGHNLSSFFTLLKEAWNLKEDPNFIHIMERRSLSCSVRWTLPVANRCGSGVQFRMPAKIEWGRRKEKRRERERGGEGRKEKSRWWPVEAVGGPPRPPGLPILCKMPTSTPSSPLPSPLSLYSHFLSQRTVELWRPRRPSMATAGVSIGLSFLLSLFLPPLSLSLSFPP